MFGRRSMFLDPNNGSIPAGGGGSSASTPSVEGGGVPSPQGHLSGSPTAGGTRAPSTISPPNTPPPGMRYVAEKDYGALESRAKLLEELGIDDKSAQSYGSLIKAIKARGDDPSLLANLLTGPQQKAKADDKAGSLDPDKLRADILAEMRREQALKEYDSKHGELPKSVKAKLVEMLGKEDDPMAEVFFKAALHDLTEARYKTPRPETDPLYGLRGAEIGEDVLNGIYTSYGELAKKYKASRIGAIADAANKARTGTPAGNGGGNADGPKSDGPPRGRPDRVTVENAVRARLAGAR